MLHASPSEPGPYREAWRSSPDEEVIALARLVARAQRVRRLVAMPIVSAGVALGVLAYVVLGHALFAGIDSRAPHLIVLVTGLPLVVLAQGLAAYVGRRTIVRRSPLWIAELTQRGASPLLCEMFVRSL